MSVRFPRPALFAPVTTPSRRSERYSERVTSMLTQAQDQLTARVRDAGGPEPPQPHYAGAAKVTPKIYTTQQVNTNLNTDWLSEV